MNKLIGFHKATSSYINSMSIITKEETKIWKKKLLQGIITQNFIYYCIYLKNFSFKYSDIFINKNIYPFFNSSSCSIIKYSKYDDRYILNIRCVNYYLNLIGNSSIVDKNNICFTSNFILILDKNFNILYKNKLMPDISDSKYVGIEDIRLFNFRDKIYYIGSTFDKITNKIKITSSEFNLDKNYEVNLINPTFKTDFNWEKNWVFFENNEEMFIIYKWYPIQICKIDYNKKELNIIKEINVPDIFYNFRGSTNGVLFNNRIWFIIHSQIEIDEKKHYFHRFVVLNKDLTIYGYSKMFKFENYIVEFCIGMELTYKNNFVITYSTLDSTTKLCVIFVKSIEKLLILV